MRLPRELKIATRTLRTALRAVTHNLAAPLKVPSPATKGLDFPDLGSFVRSFAQPGPAAPQANATGRLEDFTAFGSNPGRLRMLAYTPAGGAPAGAPLVVVLHGCTQGAADFARDTGWTALADELHFALIVPEQSGRNHQGRCFQWFQPAQAARGEGEALSIRQMVAAGIERFDADPKRVFVVGLSAGGAMTAAMLAAYPDVFAAGAVVAGLPVGAASSTTEALMRMAQPGPERTPAEWAEQVRAATPARERRGLPRISIWHGTADSVVDAGNGDLLATQWGAAHGLDTAPSSDTTLPAARHRSWSKSGRAVMEQWTIPGMRHGYPIDAKTGKAAPFILDVDLPATRLIARFWGLL